MFLHNRRIAFSSGDVLHEPQTVKRIVGIIDTAFVDRAKVIFDVSLRQRGSPEYHRGLQLALIHDLQVFLHDKRRLDEQAAHTDRVRLLLSSGVEHRFNGASDAEIDHLVAVVREDDINEVLPDVVDISFDRRDHHRPLVRVSILFHERLQHGDRRFHDFGRLQNEWQLHLPGAKEISNHFHPIQEDRINDLKRGVPFHPFLQIRLKPNLVSIDDAILEPFLYGRVGVGGFGFFFGLASGAVRQQLAERIVHTFPVGSLSFELAIIEYKLPAQLTRSLVDLEQRHDLRRMDDGHVETCLDSIMKEDAIQSVTQSCVETEGHVADAETRMHSGQLFLHKPDGFESLQGGFSEFLFSGSEREREHIEYQIARMKAVLANGQFMNSFGDSQFLGGGLCHPLFIDRQSDDGSPVPFAESHNLRQPLFAVLKVNRVHHRLPGDPLESFFDDGDFGRIKNEGNRDLCIEPGHQLAHVGGLVPPSVSNTNIQHVSLLANLVTPHGDHSFPVLLDQEVTEHLAPIGIGAFADQDRWGKRFEGDCLIKARGTRCKIKWARSRSEMSDR